MKVPDPDTLVELQKAQEEIIHLQKELSESRTENNTLSANITGLNGDISQLQAENDKLNAIIKVTYSARNYS